MTVEDFKRTASEAAPPKNISQPLLALWHDVRGDWNAAHETAQSAEDEAGAWVHAYLHRKEGDASNAAYWYRRARKPIATDALSTEWERIVSALLA